MQWLSINFEKYSCKLQTHVATKTLKVPFQNEWQGTPMITESLCHPQPNRVILGHILKKSFCSLNVDHLWLDQRKMKVVLYRYLHHLRYPDNIYTFYQTSWHFIVWDYVWRNVVCWVSFCDCWDYKIEKLCRILICEITPGLSCWLPLGRGLPLL